MAVVQAIQKVPSMVTDVCERCQAVGIQKSQGLLDLHAFTGADWGGKFATISERR